MEDRLLLREEVVALLISMGLAARSAPTVADAEPAEAVALADRAVDARGARGDTAEGHLVLLAAAARYATNEEVRS